MANEEQIESVARLYTKATENDWRTVQPTAQQATREQAGAGNEVTTEGESAAQPGTTQSTMTTADTIKLMNVARSILVNENGTVG